MALSPPSEERHGDGNVPEETIDEFERLCTRFFSPSPPTFYSTMEFPNSTMNSFPGGEVLTPSSSSSEDQQPSPLDVERDTFGADAVANLASGNYAMSLNISSPSEQSEGASDNSMDASDILSSPASCNFVVPQQPQFPSFSPDAEIHDWPPYSHADDTQNDYEGQTPSNRGTRTASGPTRLQALSVANPASFSTSYLVPQVTLEQQNLAWPTPPPQYNIYSPYSYSSSTSLAVTPRSLTTLDNPGFIWSPQIQPLPLLDQFTMPQSYNPIATSLHTMPSSISGPEDVGLTIHETGTAESVEYVSQPGPSHAPYPCEQDLAIATSREHGRHRPSRRVPSTVLQPRAQPHSPLSSESSSPPSATSPISVTGIRKKGGRPLGRSLPKECRRSAAEMRGNACWPCAVNREKCSKGEPCTRCTSMSQRSKAFGLGCDRRHLKKDLLPSFIPISMDPRQIYNDIMVYITEDVSGWNDHPSAQHGIKVPFSIGVGSPFVWTCHEYRPAANNSLQNLNWITAGQGGPWKRAVTLSPPLAIKDLDVDLLNSWMDQLIDDSLEDVGEIYYWEGHQLRTQLVKSLCSLYESLRADYSKSKPTDSPKLLHDDLRRVISLILVTYIMNHAFTVEHELRAEVIRRLSCYNNPKLYAEMLILKTANSQLKFGFSKLRFDMHLTLLNRLQTIMKHARYKEWWLSAFVIMLGLAITLEEYQHLLYVQADSRAAKGEDYCTSTNKARSHCTDIDDGYEFLQKLYHYKYSARNSDRASFDAWTNKTSHPAEARFVRDMLETFNQYRMVLLVRKDLTVSSVAEDNHVLRLVGRFLTSMMS
ncbi:hypothetical protein BDV97DRAFT_344706 [Delphinella strobiligena]|nr:hypothetical protein BDV97DRAFT_344706 [Delphinella strobiligena]